jgi:hypothetical protein
MCEVEFWEVFLSKVLRFFMWLPSNPHVNCRLANLELLIFKTPLRGFSTRGDRSKFVLPAALPDASLQLKKQDSGVF